MSGRVDQIAIDHFIYTEVTVGLKKQGPDENDIGKSANEKFMSDGLALAQKRATLYKNAVLKLMKSDKPASSLKLKNIESQYQFYLSDQAGFARFPTWSEAADIEKNLGMPGYVLIHDRDLEKNIGRTVIHFEKIPALSEVEKVRETLTQALEKLREK